MSRPRYRWWGYVRAIIKNYPATINKYINGTTLREHNAVKNAISDTKEMVDGKERMQLVELVFFKSTHTLQGASRMIPCSYELAKRWQQDFIKLVAKKYGLMD